MFKKFYFHCIILTLSVLPLLCCSKEQEKICDSACEEHRAFALSINKVVFKFDQSGRHNFSSDISITKTETGAIAKYSHYARTEFGRPNTTNRKAFLDEEEWLDFVNALYKCNTNKWERKYMGERGQFGISWNVDIFSSGKNEPDAFSGKNEYPLNWNEFTKAIKDVEEKVKVKNKKQENASAETKLATEYEEKFGESITDFELSIMKAEFNIKNEFVSIAKTETGAVLKNGEDYENWNKGKSFKLELDMGEWLDFIRALRKSRVNEWEEKYESNIPAAIRKIFKSSNETWRFSIYTPYEKEGRIFSGNNAYPPNWKEFEKTMSGIMAKIRKVQDESDNRLKAEYLKKFGEPITNSELSVRSVLCEIRNRNRKFEKYTITVFRTETGAVAEYPHAHNKSVKLDVGEWLDFVRNLHKFTKELGEEYKTTPYAGNDWRLDIFSLDGYESNVMDKDEVYLGGRKYPPNWNEFEMLMLDIAKKIEKAPYVEIENKLQAAYQKRFGEPITDFELSIKEVRFDTYGIISVSRTDFGAVAYYFLARQDHERVDVNLTTEEWLDFIRVLRKSRVNEWKGEYGTPSRYYPSWDLRISASGLIQSYDSEGYNAEPPNWKEFKKTMDGIKARISACKKSRSACG